MGGPISRAAAAGGATRGGRGGGRAGWGGVSSARAGVHLRSHACEEAGGRAVGCSWAAPWPAGLASWPRGEPCAVQGWPIARGRGAGRTPPGARAPSRRPAAPAPLSTRRLPPPGAGGEPPPSTGRVKWGAEAGVWRRGAGTRFDGLRGEHPMRADDPFLPLSKPTLTLGEGGGRSPAPSLPPAPAAYKWNQPHFTHTHTHTHPFPLPPPPTTAQVRRVQRAPRLPVRPQASRLRQGPLPDAGQRGVHPRLYEWLVPRGAAGVHSEGQRRGFRGVRLLHRHQGRTAA